MTITVKQPSPELLSLMNAAASSIIGFGELWDSIKKKGIDEGFKVEELEKLFAPMVKGKLTEAQLRYLVHKDSEIERSRSNRQKQKEVLKNAAYVHDIPPKKDTEQFDSTEDIFDKKPMTITKDSTQFYKEQQVYPSKQAEDEPSPLELAEIKIAQLEDALHKTQQFKPAREIVPLHGVIEETEVFDWLAKRDDQQSQFFFDSYGIDLFKNRIVPQLKNSGVTVFKRLYFEV